VAAFVARIARKRNAGNVRVSRGAVQHEPSDGARLSRHPGKGLPELQRCNPGYSPLRCYAQKLAGPAGVSRRAPNVYQPACKPGSVGRGNFPPATAIPLRPRLLGGCSNLPGRHWIRTWIPDRDLLASHRPEPSLFGLAPGGVCHAACVAADAVRSYRTFSPLPPRPSNFRKGNDRLERRSVLCGTFPRLAPAGRYPAPHVHGARTFLPGRPFGIGPSGRPAD
jgi:hypothetical protein